MTLGARDVAVFVAVRDRADVFDLVLLAGASVAAAMRARLALARFFLEMIFEWSFIEVERSTLGTDCVSTLGSDEMCLVVERVWRRSPSLRPAGTLGSRAVSIFGNSRAKHGF